MSRRPNRTPVEDGSGHAEAFELEEQNDRRLESLSAKVAALHDVSISINSEVDSQNRLLDGSAETFGRFGNMLGRTRGQLARTMATANSRFLCYLTLVLVLGVLGLYFVARRLLSSSPSAPLDI
ncbi:hypothetical protein H4R18_000663 [Coemansia javaensis]|uniref:t-SNARE coiled-coil homology domain-containing protein n=1 Tax=Coemansia javaensis TaxID=2761396 RepID=A0A9W8LMQ8_9FUNG|nr:hypothetical protein H4R18_000663 [Coemansia javaensis]